MFMVEVLFCFFFSIFLLSNLLVMEICAILDLGVCENTCKGKIKSQSDKILGLKISKETFR